MCNVFIFQVLIKPVFDLADSPSKQRLHLGDLAPFASDFAVHHQYEGIFFRGPLPSYDGGVDDVVPPLPALAPQAAREVPGYDNPVLGAILLHLLAQDSVLLLAPLGARANVFGCGQA